VASKNAKAPATLDVIKKMIRTLDLSTLQGVRDRAVILLGFALSGRRSELVHYLVEDCAEHEEGLVLQLRRSKTDQEQVGRAVAVARSPDPKACPVVALKAWLERGRIRTGPIFRGLTRGGNRVRPTRLSPGGVAKIVKAAAVAAGLEGSTFAGHSLRAGHVTEARSRGVSWDKIMEQGGWKKLETVKRYDRGTKDPFKVSSATEVFAIQEKKKK
jgi:integrase